LLLIGIVSWLRRPGWPTCVQVNVAEQRRDRRPLPGFSFPCPAPLLASCMRKHIANAMRRLGFAGEENAKSVFGHARLR
jgi:hypothetical protein